MCSLQTIIQKSVCLGLLVALALPVTAQPARVQFIHAAPDLALEKVDLYVNGSLFVDSLEYASATAYLDLPTLGGVQLALAPAGSPSVADAVLTIERDFSAGEQFYVVVAGVMNASEYPDNPEGLATGLDFHFDSRATESAPEGQFKILMFHGVADGPGLDFWLDPVSGADVRLRDNVSFGGFSNLLGDYVSNLTGGSGSYYYTPDYRAWPRLFNPPAMDFSTASGEQILEVAIGTYDRRQLTRKLQWLWVHPDGSTELADVKNRPAEVQFIAASPDPELEVFDLWVDGFKVKDDVSYGGCTPFIELTAGMPIKFGIAPADSRWAFQADYSRVVEFPPMSRQYAVLAGVQDPAAFPASPQGADVSLDLYTTNARAPAGGSYVHWRLFHGVVDFPKVDFWGLSGYSFQAYDDLAFGQFGREWGLQPSVLPGMISDPDVQSPLIPPAVSDFSEFSGEVILGVIMGNDGDVIWRVFRADGREYDQPMLTGMEPREIPLDFSLVGNYPNPFNPSTEIVFDLPISTNVRLEVFDLMGRVVTTLFDGEMVAGRQTVRWEASEAATGAYLYRVTTPQWTATRPMMLIR
ncbi:MAG: DUF4397 domain-containing protein [Rhodothermales bacterium]|nr:DUF4397 domain-containing protein [Rhodothermales bacterium]